MNINIDVNFNGFYKHGGDDDKTKARLTEMEGLGMTLVGVAQFGYKDVMSGLYVEKVWSYSEEFKSYMNWVKKLILKHKEKINA